MASRLGLGVEGKASTLVLGLRARGANPQLGPSPYPPLGQLPGPVHKPHNCPGRRRELAEPFRNELHQHLREWGLGRAGGLEGSRLREGSCQGSRLPEQLQAGDGLLGARPLISTP